MDHNTPNPKQPLKLLRQYGWLFLCAFLLWGLACALHFVQSDHHAEAVLSFCYAEVAQGLTPCGTWLDLAEICSEEVLTSALDQSGGQSSLTTSTLAGCITVAPAHTELEREDLFCTDYRVCLDTGPLRPNDMDAQALLLSLCNAYTDFFAEHYGSNQNLLSRTDPLITDGSDPIAHLDHLERTARQWQRYLQMRMDESRTRGCDTDAECFAALLKQLQVLLEYTFPEAEAQAANGSTGALCELEKTLDQLQTDLLQTDTAYLAEQTLIAVYPSELTLWQRVAPGRALAETAGCLLLILTGLCWYKRRKGGCRQ